MKTFEMMKLAEKSGKTYKTGDLYYRNKYGFTSIDKSRQWNASAFNYLNELLEVDDWKEVERVKLTIREIEEELGYEIEIVE